LVFLVPHAVYTFTQANKNTGVWLPLVSADQHTGNNCYVWNISKALFYFLSTHMWEANLPQLHCQSVPAAGLQRSQF